MPKKLSFKEKILGKVVDTALQKVYEYLVWCEEEGIQPNLESYEDFVQCINDYMKEGN